MFQFIGADFCQLGRARQSPRSLFEEIGLSRICQAPVGFPPRLAPLRRRSPVCSGCWLLARGCHGIEPIKLTTPHEEIPRLAFAAVLLISAYQPCIRKLDRSPKCRFEDSAALGSIRRNNPSRTNKPLGEKVCF